MAKAERLQGELVVSKNAGGGAWAGAGDTGGGGADAVVAIDAVSPEHGGPTARAEVSGFSLGRRYRVVTADRAAPIDVRVGRAGASGLDRIVPVVRPDKVGQSAAHIGRYWS